MQTATNTSNRPVINDDYNTSARGGKKRNLPGNIMWTFLFLAVSMGLLISSCDLIGGSDDNDHVVSGEWLIPQSEIFDGGPGKDGIPSIDAPSFSFPSNISYVDDDRLIAAVNIRGHILAYPHQVLDWHEIVNDQFGDVSAAIMHCPLTGTAMAWNRKIDGKETEFGVSGLLFRNNLIAYDRNTDSKWSQMQLRSVNGSLSGMDIETFQVLETTWKTWLELYPESRVLTTATGFQRNYTGFTYGNNYLTDDSIILFPVKNSDNRLNNKTRVHGIIDNESANEEATVRVYPIEAFDEGVTLVEDRVGNRDYLIVGSSGKNFAAAFLKILPDGSRPTFEAVQDELPIILRDDEGNSWDIFGVAIAGPRKGERLTPARSYTGYWFAWADFFPGLGIHGRE